MTVMPLQQADTLSLCPASVVLLGGPAPHNVQNFAAECVDDLSLDEEDESAGEEADKDGSKEQAAGETMPVAAAEEPAPADDDAVPEVCLADIPALRCFGRTPFWPARLLS